MEEETKILANKELDSFSSDNSYKMYIKEIKQYKVLPADEQKKVAAHYIEFKDQKSRELLINSNLLLVVRIARKYTSAIKHLNILDLIQEGNIGLIKAVENYNPNEGAFSTYAAYWIEFEIARSIASKEKSIRIPVHVEEQTRRYINLVLECEKMNKPLPSDKEICAKINIPESVLKNIRTSLNQKVISLSTPISGKENTFLEDCIPDKDNRIEQVNDKLYEHDFCAVAKEVLTPREYYVIYKRFLAKNQLKLEQIGNLLNVTREGVRLIQNRAIKKLKPYLSGSQIKYVELLKEIKEREGYLYYYLNLEPITPNQIIYYYYIKDTLTKLEDTLYRLTYFSKYKITNKALFLGLTNEEYKNLLKTFSKKLRVYDKNDYFKFQTDMLNMHGKKILSLINRECTVSNNATLKRCLESS